MTLSHSVARVDEGVREKTRWFVTMPKTPPPSASLSGIGKRPDVETTSTNRFATGPGEGGYLAKPELRTHRVAEPVPELRFGARYRCDIRGRRLSMRCSRQRRRNSAVPQNRRTCYFRRRQNRTDPTGSVAFGSLPTFAQTGTRRRNKIRIHATRRTRSDGTRARRPTNRRTTTHARTGKTRLKP